MSFKKRFRDFVEAVAKFGEEQRHRNLWQRSRYCCSDAAMRKNNQFLSVENQYDYLEDNVAPLTCYSYKEQLKIKLRHLKNTLVLIKDQHSRRWSHNTPIIYPIAHSPAIHHYRNKDEFNFRMGLNGDPKTLGFFVGKPEFGASFCVNSTYLKSIRQTHKDVAAAFEDYVRKSEFGACHDLHDGGIWRSLVVRSNEQQDMMVIVITHPRNRTEQQIFAERQHLRQHFLPTIQQHITSANVASFYHQTCEHTRCSNEQSPFVLLHGEPYIYERLLHCKFRISPDSFFQVNTAAAEILYQQLFKLAALTDTTTVLDLGCGVGTISILANKQIRSAIGIELQTSAVKDAYANAAINNVTNCEFVQGRLELNLNRVLNGLDYVTEIVAFVNTGRSGLHDRVIELIRRCRQIRRLLYIACKLDHPNVLRNIELLTATASASSSNNNTRKTVPFHLSCVKPIDLFPLTEHYETILLFTR